jgi:hypothetical protein
VLATLYDIHGNLAALEAVLAELPDGATIVVGGDVCFAGEQPAETLERLRSLGERVVWVRGNTDREIATESHLSHGQAAFLRGLQPTVQIDRVLYCHASPRNDMDIFTERTPEDRIAPFEDEPGAYWTVDLEHRFTPYEGAQAPERTRAEMLAEYIRIGL